MQLESRMDEVQGTLKHILSILQSPGDHTRPDNLGNTHVGSKQDAVPAGNSGVADNPPQPTMDDWIKELLPARIPGGSAEDSLLRVTKTQAKQLGEVGPSSGSQSLPVVTVHRGHNVITETGDEEDDFLKTASKFAPMREILYLDEAARLLDDGCQAPHDHFLNAENRLSPSASRHTPRGTPKDVNITGTGDRPAPDGQDPLDLGLCSEHDARLWFNS